MTRDEHMNWAKRRALAYLPTNPQEAVTSMLSDLNKHDELRPIIMEGPLGMIGLMVAASNNPAEARSFIEGFN